MKPTSLLLCCLLPAAFLPPQAEGRGTNDIFNLTDQSADLSKQADGILQDANSPQQFHEAASLLERAVAADPGDLDTQFKLGWVYLDKLHDPLRAYPHLALVAKRRPDDADARKLFGLDCSQTGRMQQAVKEFRKASLLQPDDLWIRANLGRSLARTGHWSEAEKIYNEILRTDPKNEPARLGLAELSAWRGRSAMPLEMLDGIVKDDPTNAEALVLMGDLNRWNWQLTSARHDYDEALSASPGVYGADSGLKETAIMSMPRATISGYQFTDKNDFGQVSAAVDARVPLVDQAYLTAGADAWRFSSPGFERLYRVDGHGGLEFHFNRWLETSAEVDSFNTGRYHGHESSFGGAQLSAKISPLPGSDIYLIGAYNQPFVSSMPTVTNSMKQSSGGSGLDIKLPARFSVQNSIVAANITDGNSWWEEKPQLSYQLFEHPDTHLRVQYDFLHYSEQRTNYWTPGNWRVLSPVLSTSLPFGECFHIDVDGSAPYVLNVSRWGYQVEGGPRLTLGKHFEAKASGIIAYIPGDQVTWSGHGWRAYMRISF